MKVDKFLASLGIVDAEIPPEGRVLLVEKAKEFFRAGMALSWNDLLQMEDDMLAVFTEARSAVDDEKAARLLEALATALEKVTK